MSNNKSNNDDATNTSNKESAEITKISDAQANANAHKHASLMPKSSPRSLTSTDNLATLETNRNNDSTIDDSRIEHLKSAIGSGHFRINPYRVAEKFILFETQLSSS